VREDVIQVMLQVKQVRIKMDGVDSARMQLEVRGEGRSLRLILLLPAEIEFVNPDTYLLPWMGPDKTRY